MALSQAQKDFIAKAGAFASADMARSGVLASLKTAQAILESGWGTSALATQANALFGIKADSRWGGKVYSTATKECYDGVNFTTVDALFRAYDSWEHSLADHSAFLKASARYAAVIGERDYKKACTAIHAAGYATDPGYAGKLINLIETHGLTAYDAVQAGEGAKMKLYLSPSNQPGNKYVVGNTNEKAEMEAVAAKVKAILDKDYNCEAVMATLSMGIGANERPQEAKNKGCEYYIAIHSNAAGSSPSTASGAVAFFHPDSAKSKALATAAVNDLNAICPIKSNRASQAVSGMTQFDGSGYGEIRSPMQKGVHPVLIEVNFHDNPVTAQWIIGAKDEIAGAIVKSLTTTLGIGEKDGSASAPTPSTPPPTPTTPASPAGFKVGDIVQFTGGGVYTSSTSVTASAIKCNASHCKVTQINSGARYPYHLISEDKAGVWGWVPADDVKAIGQAPAAPFTAYTVKVTADVLNIRKGPGTDTAIVGDIKDKGVYTIVEEANGPGASKWGKLKSGAGWISLDYTQKR